METVRDTDDRLHLTPHQPTIPRVDEIAVDNGGIKKKTGDLGESNRLL